MVFCSTPTFFCYSSNSPKYRLFRQNPSPLNFCLERYSFNTFALSENYALLVVRNVEFSQ